MPAGRVASVAQKGIAMVFVDLALRVGNSRATRALQDICVNEKWVYKLTNNPRSEHQAMSRNSIIQYSQNGFSLRV